MPSEGQIVHRFKRLLPLKGYGSITEIAMFFSLSMPLESLEIHSVWSHIMFQIHIISAQYSKKRDSGEEWNQDFSPSLRKK